MENFRAVGYIHFLGYRGYVFLHRSLSTEQLIRNLLIGHTAANKPRNLSFPVRKTETLYQNFLSQLSLGILGMEFINTTGNQGLNSSFSSKLPLSLRRSSQNLPKSNP